MTYYTVEINEVFGATYEYKNVRNLGWARKFAEWRSARTIGCTVVVIDQATGAIMSEYTDGICTYMDLDPYAGY